VFSHFRDIQCQKWRDLENQVRGRSRSLKMAPFDRPYATFYWSAIVNIALSCTIFELVLRSSGVRLANHSHCQVWYGIVEFNVTLDTLYHFGYHFTGQMTQTTLLHTERQWLVNHVKHQSHQAQLTERDREGCKQKLFYI